MATELIFDQNSTKREKFDSLMPQLEALIHDETDLVANMANVAAALYQGLGYFWVGFYLVRNEELVLGPFQGPIACTRIKKGKGVCGKAWETGKSVVIPDVNKFPGHIACNNTSQSEMVVPCLDEQDKVRFVLDVDSDHLNAFDAVDEQYLARIVGLL